MAQTVDSRRRTWQVAALLFGSGACALVYQTAWMREFRLIFGASTAASAAVLAIFIGGLGLGSLLLGPEADKRSRPILFYSQLESIVAVSAAATPLLLMLIARLYVGVGGTARLGLVVGTVGRLLLSSLVLAIPTIAMGGTLPAAARGVTRQTDVRRQDVAALYGLNTLGAVVGCVTASFLLLEMLGTRATLWLAAAVNLLVAVFARQVDRSMPAEDAPVPTAAAARKATETAQQAPLAFLLTASAVIGFVFFLMELVWYRMLGPLLGGSVFTFGLILGVALAGIGIGGLVYSLVGSDRPATLGGFATTCLLEAVFTAAAFALGDRLAILALALLPLGHASFAAQVVGWSLITAIVVLPASIVSGYQFPLLIGLLGRGRAAVGRQVGLAYTANTAGAIVGSLAGGFGLIPWLSATGTWRLSAAALVAIALATVVVGLIRRGRPHVFAPAALATATIALLLAAGPTSVWRHSGIGAGRSGLPTIPSRNQLTAWSNEVKAAGVWAVDGVESSVSLRADSRGYSFYVNGKSDGSARTDAGTQVMSGLLGAILHPAARRSLVIGLGTGSTAGWLAAVPTMERVDVVELEPAVIEVARACRLVNHDALSNPKLHVTIGDARELLLTSPAQYDLISSEPSNPFRAGIASLFTREYYEAANARLAPDGMFLQWVQAYEIDARTLRTIYATLGSVFPSVETWQSSSADLVLVCAKHPIAYPAPALARRIAEEPFRTALQSAWRAVDLTGLFGHYIAGDGLTRAVASVRSIELNTDDRNVVEFGFARSVGRSSTIFAQVRTLARDVGASHPAATGGEVDWSVVDTGWVSYLVSEDQFVQPNPLAPAAEQARQQALVSYFVQNDRAGARRAWARQDQPPRDLNELAMIADVEADAASDQAPRYIEQLRAIQPTEADLMLARLRFKQGRDMEAAAAMAAVFRGLRTDPWPLTRYKLEAVLVADALAARTPATIPTLYDAIQMPFAIGALNTDRYALATRLALRGKLGRQCADRLHPLEPNVPWTREFLLTRHECYASVGDPRSAQAERDIAEFAAAEGLPLATGVAVRPVTRTGALQSDPGARP